jgi:uncharacterized protein YciI
MNTERRGRCHPDWIGIPSIPRRQPMYVFVRTNNQRPTFHLDMTDAEKQVMQQHVAYWTEKGKQGIAIVFGPVLDPKGVYGIGIYRVDDLAHMRRLLADDPAREILTYEVFEMPRAVVGSPPV